MPVSRREFLKRSSLLAALRVPTSVDANSSLWRLRESVGRTFRLTDIHSDPNPTSAVVGQFAPDSVIPITAALEGWYQVPPGYVPRAAVQPIQAYNLSEADSGFGFWAELAAPVSVIREWCSGLAPIVARPGYGAMLYGIDRLQDDRSQIWYGLASGPDGRLIGWGMASHYRRWRPAVSSEGPVTVRLAARTLTAYRADRPIGSTPVYAPSLLPAVTTIRALAPGGTLEDHVGVPWLMTSGTGIAIHGVYWHNQFGAISDGTAIELPTAAGRWLYEQLGPGENPLVITR
ncbi:MAG TPA: L,D-transpeptidase [Aggregatilineales bacterium]|nr:L,D-transpeptidase [Aggregatilineales bacterium]